MKYVICALIFATAALPLWAICRASGASDRRYEELARRKFFGEDCGDG